MLKFGKFIDEEFEIMKWYIVIGGEMFDVVVGVYFEVKFFVMVWDIVWIYYECIDGIGYFNGLMGDEILFVGCIVVVVDVYDVLISSWVYKLVFSYEIVRDIILDGCGSYFDLMIVDVFLVCED